MYPAGTNEEFQRCHVNVEVAGQSGFGIVASLLLLYGRRTVVLRRRVHRVVIEFQALRYRLDFDVSFFLQVCFPRLQRSFSPKYRFLRHLRFHFLDVNRGGHRRHRKFSLH